MYPAYSSLYSQSSGQFSPIVMTESVNIAGNMIGINVDINQTGNLSSSSYYVNYIVAREQDSDYFSSVVAWERTLNYSVSTAGRGLKNFLFGDQLITRFSGHGKLWVQSRSTHNLVSFLHPFRRVKPRNDG